MTPLDVAIGKSQPLFIGHPAAASNLSFFFQQNGSSKMILAFLLVCFLFLCVAKTLHF
jgi:hypothetical protein